MPYKNNYTHPQGSFPSIYIRSVGHASSVPLHCRRRLRLKRTVTGYTTCAFLLLSLSPPVTIPPDNTWHARGTVLCASYPLHLFGVQDVQDPWFYACVWSFLYRNFVSQLGLLPTRFLWSGVRGCCRVFRARLLFGALVAIPAVVDTGGAG